MLNILLLVSFIQFVLFSFFLPLLLFYFSLCLSFYNFIRLVFPADFLCCFISSASVCDCELIFDHTIFTQISFCRFCAFVIYETIFRILFVLIFLILKLKFQIIEPICFCGNYEKNLTFYVDSGKSINNKQKAKEKRNIQIT